jgi:hypothetical protein
VKGKAPPDQVFEGETMSFATKGGFAVVLHPNVTPSDQEWQKYLDAAGEIARSGEPMPTLVFTDGGAPTGDQREPLVAIFKDLDAPVAVVSDVAAIRFIASSMAFMGLKIKGFSSQSWRTAFQHFKSTPERKIECERRLVELRAAGFGARVGTWVAAMEVS